MHIIYNLYASSVYIYIYFYRSCTYSVELEIFGVIKRGKKMFKATKQRNKKYYLPLYIPWYICIYKILYTYTSKQKDKILKLSFLRSSFLRHGYVENTFFPG